MIGLTVDYVWTWLKYRSRTLFRRKRKMRFPNGIPRVLTTETEFVAQQMQRVVAGDLTYEEFTALMNSYGREHG